MCIDHLMINDYFVANLFIQFKTTSLEISIMKLKILTDIAENNHRE